MALRTRTVTGTITDAEGTPINGGQVSFTLDKPIGYTDTHVVVDPTVFATTDINGEFAIDLWCDEDSSLPLNYTVLVPIVDSGAADATHKATISLAYEDGSDKDIGQLIFESTPPPSDVPDATWSEFIDNRIGNGNIYVLSGTSYTILASNAGDTIRTTSGSGVTVTVPDALPVGFQCLVLQDGDGQVEFTSSDATVRNRQSHTKIAGKYGVVTILKVASGEFRLQGDTAS